MSGTTTHAGWGRWLDYLDHGAETYLRRYMFFLATGRVPAVNESALPDLMLRR